MRVEGVEGGIERGPPATQGGLVMGIGLGLRLTLMRSWSRPLSASPQLWLLGSSNAFTGPSPFNTY